jgi:hypothetical protein
VDDAGILSIEDSGRPHAEEMWASAINLLPTGLLDLLLLVLMLLLTRRLDLRSTCDCFSFVLSYSCSCSCSCSKREKEGEIESSYPPSRTGHESMGWLVGGMIPDLESSLKEVCCDFLKRPSAALPDGNSFFPCLLVLPECVSQSNVDDLPAPPSGSLAVFRMGSTPSQLLKPPCIPPSSPPRGSQGGRSKVIRPATPQSGCCCLSQLASDVALLSLP